MATNNWLLASHAANNLRNNAITIKTTNSNQAHIDMQALMNWMFDKGYIPNNVNAYRFIPTSWDYANNDILQFTEREKLYELLLAGVIIEFVGNATAYNEGMFRIRIHTAPTRSWTVAAGYTAVPVSSIWEYFCNGSSYSPTWRCIAPIVSYNNGTEFLINSGDTNKLAYYSAANTISAGAINTNGSYLRNVGGYNNSSYALSTASFISNSWVRTVGATGWYSETYGGGWYMSDTTWIRTYNNKSVYSGSGKIRSDESLWGQKVRITADWIGFYAAIDNTTTRYGYIQCPADRMYFRKENTTPAQTNGIAFDFNGGAIFTNANGIIALHGHIFTVAGNEFNWIPDGYDSTMWLNYDTFNRQNNGNISRYLFGNGHHQARARIESAQLYIHPVDGSYQEGIRIYSFSSWTTIILGGNDLTADTGTSANSWSIHNNNSNFYLTRNGSSASGTDATRSEFSSVGNQWRIRSYVLAHKAGIYRSGLHIYGLTYGNTATDMASGKAGVFRWNDGGPQITFDTSGTPGGSQAGALIFTDHDSAGVGASFHFVSNQNSNDYGGDLTVTAPRFRARRGLTVNSNSDLATDTYRLYVVGLSYYTGLMVSEYKSGTWVNSLTNSAVVLTDAAGSFGGWICGPTNEGRITISTYQASNNNIYLGYGERGRTSNSYAEQIYWDGKNNCLYLARVDITRHLIVSTNIAGNAYNENGSAIQIREVNRVGSAQSAWTYAPKIGFHWSGRVAVQLGLDSNLWLCLYENNSTTPGKFRLHNIILEGTTNEVMTAASANPRITFQEGTGTQPVHLIYTDWDSYRSPAGLKVIGGASATPAWFEVEGDLIVGRNVCIGNSNSNYITFYGSAGDSPGQWTNHSFIGHRLWGGSESSEIVLFNGNDVGNGDTGTTVSGAGPDRIRLIAAAHVFLTYTSALSGAFETVCTSGALKTVFEINTNYNYSLVPLQVISIGSSWIDGLRYRRSIHMTDATNTGSYWPWINQTNTSAGRWFSFGTLNNSFYWVGSASSRVDNGYDNGLEYRVTDACLQGIKWLRVINDSSNTGDDTAAYIRARTSNDWTMIIDSAGANYGLYVNAENQSEAIRTNGQIRCYRLWANMGSNGERLIGTDSSTSGTIYLWSNTSNKGIYSSTGYRTGYVIMLNANGSYSYCAMSPYGFGNGSGQTSSCCFTYYASDGSFAGRSGWAHYLIGNHGDGSSYYHWILGMPFWGPPVYRRLEGGTARGWYTLISTENAGTLWWANVQCSTASNSGTQPTFNTCYTSNWFRSTGATGWYSQTYGGGIWMQDSTYVRVYNSKHFWIDASLYVSQNNATGGGIYLADDGSIVDPNNGYCRMRFTYGVLITAGKNNDTDRIGLRYDGWIYFYNGHNGLYWPNCNGAHLYANDYTSYGALVTNGTRGGYYGMVFGPGTQFIHVMDSGEHKGFYEQDANWLYYFQRSNGHITIWGTSYSGWRINLGDNTYCYGAFYSGDVRGGRVRVVDNWVGFYQSANAGGVRYGYIQADGNRMYFRKENGASGNVSFDFGSTLYCAGEVMAPVHMRIGATILRDDGSNFYFLVGTRNSPGNNWNGLRPFYFSLSNGYSYHTRAYLAVWNDYAEFRKGDTIEPGRCVVETKSGIMTKSTQRLLPGAKMISDTYGEAMGETKEAKTPIAVSGRMLAYPYRNRNEYLLGAAVCSAPGGTVDIMTREEIMKYPERIVGTVSEIPTYEIWHSGGSVELGPTEEIKVNGRIWIYVR